MHLTCAPEHQTPVFAEQERPGLEAANNVPVEAPCAGMRALRVEKAMCRGCSGLQDVQHRRDGADARHLAPGGHLAGSPQPSRAFPAGALLCMAVHNCGVSEARRLGIVLLHDFLVFEGEHMPLAWRRALPCQIYP